MHHEDNTLSRFERQHPSILQVLLGKYAFGDHTEILFPAQSGNVYPDLTEIHESLHMHLCTSTTFGLFQKLLGLLLQDPNLPDYLRQVYERALDFSINCSWFTHEGCATSAELIVTVARGPDAYRHSYRDLPKNYKKAVEPFRAVLDSMRLPSFLALFFSEALAHVALATDILDDMVIHNNALETKWDTYFASIERNPDTRLRILFQEVLNHSLLQELSNILWIVAKDTVNAATLAPEEIIRRFDNLEKGRKFAFFDTIIETTVSVLQPKLPFPVADIWPRDIFKKVRRLWESWFESLEKMGVSLKHSYQLYKIPENSHDQCFDHELNISYVPKEEESRFIAAVIPYPALWDEVCKTNSFLYLHFIYNSASDSIPIELLYKGTSRNSPIRRMVIEPGGGYLYVQEIVRSPDGLRYFPPLGSWGVDTPQRSYFGFVIGAKDLPSVSNQLKHLNCVLTMPEGTWDAISKLYGQQSVSQESLEPVFIIPRMSTLGYWENIIRRAAKDGTVWLFQEELESLNTTFCILVTKDGTEVYARPTARIVTERLFEKSKDSSRIIARRLLAQLFSKEWNEQLRIFLHHYSTLGF